MTAERLGELDRDWQRALTASGAGAATGGVATRLLAQKTAVAVDEIVRGIRQSVDGTFIPVRDGL